MSKHDRILILDFGSQVTQLIARRVREANVYCEIKPYNTAIGDIEGFGAKGIILSGGPASVSFENSPKVDEKIFELGLPVLGICYGQQLMCEYLGGKVVSANDREFGKSKLKIDKSSSLTKDIWAEGTENIVWMSHGDRVEKLPDGFEVYGHSESAPFGCIADEKRKFYGVQFHPEVTHTAEGSKLIENFCLKISRCSGDWNMGAFEQEQVEKIREQVGDKKVIAAVSGGVDSTVVAALINEAIGEQLTCIFIDHGLLRKNEAEQVVKMFDGFGINLKKINASELFLGKLAGITDPEKKRKIIGNSFIEVFEEEAKKFGDAEFLAQGTLYPDVIESVSVHGDAAVTIKSHHNVGGLPERMNLKLIEPLRELFKDEVRELGRKLGIKEEMIARHPFPGPGLAIRIPGEITDEKIKILQKADNIYISELKRHGLYNEIWQAFAVLLPVKTVGVMGDGRTYEYVLGLRAVTSKDGMTADFYHFDMEFLSHISTKIINNVKGVNRVVYDISSKPPATIEWE